MKEKYIDSEYFVTVDKIPAEISPLLESEIIAKSKRVIALSRKGIKFTFTDIAKMEHILLNEP